MTTQKNSEFTRASAPITSQIVKIGMEMGLSSSTVQKITIILRGASKKGQRRQTALKILDMLKTTKSEEDFVKRLSELE